MGLGLDVARRGLARLDARRLLGEAREQILDVRLRVLHEDVGLQLGVERLLELAALLGGLLQQPHRLCLLVLQRRELGTQPTHRVVDPLGHGLGARRVRKEYRVLGEGLTRARARTWLGLGLGLGLGFRVRVRVSRARGGAVQPRPPAELDVNVGGAELLRQVLHGGHLGLRPATRLHAAKGQRGAIRLVVGLLLGLGLG